MESLETHTSNKRLASGLFKLESGTNCNFSMDIGFGKDNCTQEPVPAAGRQLVPILPSLIFAAKYLVFRLDEEVTLAIEAMLAPSPNSFSE